MTRSELSRRLERAADAAAERAEQARARIEEIAERLRALHSAALVDSVHDEQLSQAQHAATTAEAYSVESANRARRAHQESIELHTAAASAHDAAADALDRLIAAGIGDTAAHERHARQHRALATADRAAADLQRSLLREECGERG
jgi:hypothetical protein